MLCLQPADSAVRYDNYTTGVIGGLLRCCGADMLVSREMFRQINNVNKQQQKLTSVQLDNASLNVIKAADHGNARPCT